MRIHGPGASVILKGGLSRRPFRVLEPYVTITEDEAGGDAAVCVADAASCEGIAGGEGRRRVRLHQGHEGWFLESPDEPLVINRRLGTHYHVEPGPVPRIVCCTRSAAVSLDVLRIVRGLLFGAAVSKRGFLPVHAAVLRRADDHGVLLSGPKGSGKTSFLLALLSDPVDRGELAFIANDKALLEPATGRVHGLPFALPIGAGTLSRLPALRFAGTRWAGGKALVWPCAAAEALGFRISTSATAREEWRCELDLAAPRAELADSDGMRQDDGVGKFRYTMLPMWLFELIGWGVGATGRFDLDVSTRRLSGNPWRWWRMPEPL